MSYPNYFPYAAAKSGILGLTRNLALDEGKNGIRVNAVLPGFTLTPLIEDYFARNPEKRAEALAVQPLGRMAEPIEIAKVITFLLSDDASFVNGADWIIDGGLSGRFA
jgi:NAD(P)-dependent dehydrogenase (short-subunit alcohol dehydrogenase family)